MPSRLACVKRSGWLVFGKGNLVWFKALSQLYTVCLWGASWPRPLSHLPAEPIREVCRGGSEPPQTPLSPPSPDPPIPFRVSFFSSLLWPPVLVKHQKETNYTLLRNWNFIKRHFSLISIKWYNFASIEMCHKLYRMFLNYSSMQLGTFLPP